MRTLLALAIILLIGCAARGESPAGGRNVSNCAQGQNCTVNSITLTAGSTKAVNLSGTGSGITFKDGTSQTTAAVSGISGTLTTNKIPRATSASALGDTDITWTTGSPSSTSLAGGISMTGTSPKITTTSTTSGLTLKSSITNGNSGVIVDTTSTLTSGDVLLVDNNGSPLLDITPNTSIFANSVTLTSGNLAVNSGTSKLSGNTIIGATGTPLDQLNLQSTTSGTGGAGIRFDNFGNAGDTGYIEFLKSLNGTVSAPAAPASGDNLAAIFFDGYSGTGTNAVRGGKILVAADGNWSGSSAPTHIGVFTSASGATNGGEVFRWSSAGDSVLASGKKLCLDGTTCSKYMYVNGGNLTANGDPFVASGNITANGGQYSNAAVVRAGGTSSVSLLSQAASGGTSIISDTTTNFSAGKLHSFRNNAVEKAYIDYAGAATFVGINSSSDISSTGGGGFFGDYLYSNSSVPIQLVGQQADGATAIGARIRSNTTYSNTAAKIATFENNTTVKAYVGYDGSLYSNVADPVPAVHAAQTGAAVAIEFGSKTLSTGAGTVTFATAFSAAPICVCDDSTAVLGSQCSTSTSTLTITGTGSDVIKYICMGAR